MGRPTPRPGAPTGKRLRGFPESSSHDDQVPRRARIATAPAGDEFIPPCRPEQGGEPVRRGRPASFVRCPGIVPCGGIRDRVICLGRPPKSPEIRAWPVFRVMADGKERTGLAISQSNAVKRFMYQSSARCISIPPDPRRSHVGINSQQVEFPTQPVAPAQEHADFGSPTGDRDLRVRLSQESVHPWRVGDMPASNPA